MQAKIVGVGVDTLKVNLKRLTEGYIPDPVQELPGDLEARLKEWQEQARNEGKPLPLPPDFSQDLPILLSMGRFLFLRKTLRACTPLTAKASVASQGKSQ